LLTLTNEVSFVSNPALRFTTTSFFQKGKGCVNARIVITLSNLAELIARPVFLKKSIFVKTE